MLFYLGAPEPSWLARASVRLFVARQRFARIKGPYATAAHPWALDSGGFTELQDHGQWTITAAAYVELVRRIQAETGHLEWASIQDWMCEPIVISGGEVRQGGRKTRFAGTKLSVAEHQRRTVQSFLELCDLAPEIPWAPVLQGWTMGEYEECIELYERAGVDLLRCPRVGLGSVCRRQNTSRIVIFLLDLLRQGFKIHAFGFKREGIASLVDLATTTGELALLDNLSCDSMAWSLRLRMDGSADKNRLEGALAWREEFLAPYQERGVVVC